MPTMFAIHDHIILLGLDCFAKDVVHWQPMMIWYELLYIVNLLTRSTQWDRSVVLKCPLLPLMKITFSEI